MAVDTESERERRGTTLSLREQQDLGNIPLSSLAVKPGPGGLLCKAASLYPGREQHPRQWCFALLGAQQPQLPMSCSDAQHTGVTGCLQDSSLVLHLNMVYSLPTQNYIIFIHRNVPHLFSPIGGKQEKWVWGQTISF